MKFSTQQRGSILGPDLRDIKEPLGEMTIELGQLDVIVRSVVEETLRRCRGNRSKAVRVLGISRRSLYDWTQRWAAADRWRQRSEKNAPQKQDPKQAEERKKDDKKKDDK